jgi:hypothetical protein
VHCECSKLLNCTLCASAAEQCIWCVDQSESGAFVERCAYECRADEWQFNHTCPVYTSASVETWKLIFDPANLAIVVLLLVSIVAGSLLSAKTDGEVHAAQTEFLSAQSIKKKPWRLLIFCALPLVSSIVIVVFVLLEGWLYYVLLAVAVFASSTAIVAVFNPMFTSRFVRRWRLE